MVVPATESETAWKEMVRVATAMSWTWASPKTPVAGSKETSPGGRVRDSGFGRKGSDQMRRRLSQVTPDEVSSGGTLSGWRRLATAFGGTTGRLRARLAELPCNGLGADSRRVDENLFCR